MENRHYAIQFPHPGVVHNQKSGQGWYLCAEKKSHRRKLIQVTGTYLKGKKLEQGPLVFWGELEAPCELISSEGKYPLFKPLFDAYKNANDIPFDTMNSDPLHFGKTFYYGICRQRGNNILKDLAENSILLFGSSIDKEFHLDSLFVIKNRIKYSKKDYYRLENKIGKIPYNLNILPIYKSKKYLIPEEEFSLYSGKMYDEDQELFSYSPCIPYNGKNINANIFDRPKISLQGILTDNLSRNYKKITFNSEKELKEFFREIKRQVEKDNGCCLMLKNQM